MSLYLLNAHPYNVRMRIKTILILQLLFFMTRFLFLFSPRLKGYTIRQIYNYYAFSFLSMLITKEKVFFMGNYVVHGCKYIHINENSARFRHEKKECTLP